MKAFVIKNKEGGYSFAGGSFSKDLCISSCYETIEQCQKVINYYDLKDCEVVEITIAEGDLEHKLEVYKEALKLACDFAGLDTDKWSKEFIEQAKENINGK